MKFFNNIIIQFTVFTFIVILVVSTILAVVLSKTMTEKAIQQHIKIYPEVVKNIVRSNRDIPDFLNKDHNIQSHESIIQAFTTLLNFETVFRIKIWDLHGEILWSDKSEIIGQKFPDNIEFLAAKNGDIRYVVEHPHDQEDTLHIVDHPHDQENTSERDTTTFLELYIPILSDNDVIGVIELYEEADQLFWLIQRDNYIIWVLISISGILTYLLQFFIFLNAHRNQKITNDNLNLTLEVIITSLAQQAEIRDIETGLHLERTSTYVQLVAQYLQKTDKFKAYLSREYIDDLVKSAPLHDIGKVGIPDSILQKPGKLTKEEFSIMQKHCEYGAKILKNADAKLTFQSFLKIAIQISLHHHEKWDGTGYPHKLIGNDIPLSARIMAIADVYDALRSKRCYKDAFEHKKAIKIILDGKGSHFDPDIVDAFVALEADFETISIKLAD